MSSLHVIRHNPALRARLAAVVQGGEPEALLAVMQQLSHSERRTASYLLATDVLLAGPPAADFPRWYTVLMASSAKAWLGTLLKAAVTLYQEGRPSLADEAWRQASAMANDIDRSKWLDAFLPILRNDADAANLMQWFAPDDRMTILLTNPERVVTRPIYGDVTEEVTTMPEQTTPPEETSDAEDTTAPEAGE